MSRDSDIAVLGNAMKAHKRERRKRYGVPCPRCRELQPKRDPTILLPQQQCKVDGYCDPRPRLTQVEEDALWAKFGFIRSREPSNG